MRNALTKKYAIQLNGQPQLTFSKNEVNSVQNNANAASNTTGHRC